MAGYSLDIRKKLLEAYKNKKESGVGLTTRFKVETRTVSRHMALERQKVLCPRTFDKLGSELKGD